MLKGIQPFAAFSSSMREPVRNFKQYRLSLQESILAEIDGCVNHFYEDLHSNFLYSFHKLYSE